MMKVLAYYILLFVGANTVNKKKNNPIFLDPLSPSSSSPPPTILELVL